MDEVKSLLQGLHFGFSNRRLPVIYQTEAAECGLACLGMIAGFHGYRIDLATLRSDFPVSMKGSTLADLIRIAEQLQLAARPLKLELQDVSHLHLPCVLHWSFEHYVVLKKLVRNGAIIHDPAFGERQLSMAEFSAAFTGVALELWPDPGFKKKSAPRQLALRQLMGRVTGLLKAFGQALLLATALEIFAILAPFYIQWVLDEAIVSADRDLVTTLTVGFGLVMLMKVIVTGVRSWVLMHMSTLLSVQWRANTFTHLLRLPVLYFQKRHLGDITSRFGSIDQIQSTLTTSFLEAIMDGVMSIVTLIMMVIYSKLLGAVAAIAMLLYGLCRWAWYGALRSATSSQIVFAAKQQSHFFESMRGVRTIKLFQRESQRRTTWLGILIDQTNASLRTQKLQIIYSSVNSLLIGVENILVVWFGARMILDGDLTVGALVAFKAYDDQFASRCSGLIDKFTQFQMLKLYGERLADIVLSERERPPSLAPPRDLTELPADIKVTGLRYRYSEQDPFVLDGVSFEVAAGETVAIVGPSGCGKSTLVNVLLGVLPPTSGDVEIGGLSLQSLGPDALRRLVGTVMQDDVLFAGSIRDNVSFFDAAADWDWVQECARLAGVHDEIISMPMGYNSLVGDMGTVLSGGQKQRVLLARALYKRPRLLVLDEATSQLDIERERLINAGIKSLNITRVIVAHRPETVAIARRILSLKDGKIVAHSQPLSADALAAPLLQKAPSFMRPVSAQR